MPNGWNRGKMKFATVSFTLARLTESSVAGKAITMTVGPGKGGAKLPACRMGAAILNRAQLSFRAGLATKELKERKAGAELDVAQWLPLMFIQMSVMTNLEILEQLNSLPAAERLKIVESTVHQLRQDLERSGPRGSESTDARLARAAEALLDDYCNDLGLTSFTALDGEAFHA